MINLYDILKAANGQLFGEPAANLFTDFALDPQHVDDNTLFVAQRSDRGDTHQYIEEAIARGASGVLCTEPPDCDTDGVSVLMVRDTVDALLAWSHQIIGKLNVTTIAVAGSSGKSMALDAITRVLQTRYEVHRGNVDADGRLSVALALAKLTPKHDYVVLKLSSQNPGDMAQMVEAVQPRIVVLNHIDCVHPAAFESCKQYIDEQGVLMDFLSPGALAVFNYDDDETRELAGRAREGVDVKTIGIDRFGADVLAFNVKVGRERLGFDVRYAGERYVGRWSPVQGQHHLYGLLSAVAVADFTDIAVDDALKALTNLQPLPGRMMPLDGIHGIALFDDSYRASHSSTMAALDWLKAVDTEDTRTIFIMGDMDDVGDNSRYGHRSIGQYAAEIADIIITQGAEAALAGRAAIDVGLSARCVRTTYSAQDTVETLQSFDLNENDVVLVKGGAAARMEQVVRLLLADKADAEKLVRQQKTSIETVAHTLRPSRVEVDATVLAENVRIIKSQVGDDVTLMAVVKADGYGHGAVMAARTALMNGAGYLAVASMEEAMELRTAGIDAPVLVLSYAPAESVRQAIRQNITLSVYDLEQAKLYDRAAHDIDGQLTVHIKIDSGMGRLGFLSDDALTAFRHFQALNRLEFEGIYTHFSDADASPDYTQQQVETFQEVLRPLRAAGFSFTYIHAANSPGMLLSSDNHFNMVRPGLILYGLQPSDSVPLPDGVKPLLAWKTTILQVKTFPPGHPIGYGRTYYTQSDERIAILPVGYADGLRRSPQTWEYVLIHGQRAPLVGRVSMEKTAVNVSDIPGVKAGDEVVLLGQQGDEQITAEMIAAWLGTINYEVVTTILPRVSRL
jgi:alanine racemase